VFVQGDPVFEPTDVGLGADEDEEGSCVECPAGACLVVLHDDRREGLVADELADLGVLEDLNRGVAFQLVDEVARHFLAEVAADDQGDFLSMVS
jgi:hypothetical protein